MPNEPLQCDRELVESDRSIAVAAQEGQWGEQVH